MTSKLKSIFIVASFIIITFILHYLINLSLAGYSIPNNLIISIHGFVFFITAIVLLISVKLNKNFPDKVGFGYMGLMFFKMLASIAFLMPHFKVKANSTKLLVVNFFIIFFLYLVAEVIVITKIINSSISQKNS